MANPVRKKLFVSYAHEDRDFAWPLADDLARDHGIWIDRDELKVGDSLFRQISKGLREADYGVVILSPSYISKTWTQRELQGLTTLEDETRKVVLPVWKDINKAGVTAFSAFMGDKVAALAQKGIPAVADEIRFAVASASQAIDVIARPTSVQKLAALGQDLKARAAADALLRSEEGAGLVMADYRAIEAMLEQQIKAAGSDSLHFNIVRDAGARLLVHTGYRLTLRLDINQMFVNDASSVELGVAVYQRPPFHGDFGNSKEKPTLLDEIIFKPWFSDREVVWRRDKKTLGIAGVVEAAIDLLHRHLRAQSE